MSGSTCMHDCSWTRSSLLFEAFIKKKEERSKKKGGGSSYDSDHHWGNQGRENNLLASKSSVHHVRIGGAALLLQAVGDLSTKEDRERRVKCCLPLIFFLKNDDFPGKGFCWA